MGLLRTSMSKDDLDWYKLVLSLLMLSWIKLKHECGLLPRALGSFHPTRCRDSTHWTIALSCQPTDRAPVRLICRGNLPLAISA